ncbi:MAG: zinc-ribbon domain-containing protein [Methanocorpusculum sp.]|nr:zinc-ribbon domain-containing protein [Methanocorpusculum sp.]
MALHPDAVKGLAESFNNSGFSPTVSVILTIIIIGGMFVLIYLLRDYIGNLIWNSFSERRKMKKQELSEAEKRNSELEQKKNQIIREQAKERGGGEMEKNVVQYCMYCGAKVPPNSQFCMKCGQRLPNKK